MMMMMKMLRVMMARLMRLQASLESMLFLLRDKAREELEEALRGE